VTSNREVEELILLKIVPSKRTLGWLNWLHGEQAERETVGSIQTEIFKNVWAEVLIL
jgi:hypothetical protein